MCLVMQTHTRLDQQQRLIVKTVNLCEVWIRLLIRFDVYLFLSV